jgi:putative oligomerization/nucleic acid binding protein
MALLMRPSRPMLALLGKAVPADVSLSDEEARPLQRDVYAAQLRSTHGALLPAATASVAKLATLATGVTGELERLAELHGSGALTEDEFAAAKARLLAR